MKTEDLEFISKLLDENGYKVKCEHPETGFVFVTKKDPWEGVGFAQSDTLGRIFRVIGQYNKDWLFASNGIGLRKYECSPSTESAYVEQLKKICFEKFPEIDKGNKFLINGSVNIVPDHCGKSSYIDYDKITDSLFYQGVLIYQQGKWAELVKEPTMTKVNLNGWTLITYEETAEEAKDSAEILNNAANSIESKEPGKYEFIAVKYQGKFGVYSRMLQPMEGELL